MFLLRLIFALIFVQCINTVAKDPPSVNEKTLFQFTWANDFVYQTDYYYSNGFAFEFLGEWARQNPINKILVSAPGNSIDQYGFNLIQDVFTPQERYDIEKQLEGDRPFAAYLLLGVIKKSFDEKNRIKIISVIQIGILGPAALGKETQDGIHDLLPTSTRLNGWENQISNTLALQYSLDLYKSIPVNRWLDFSVFTKGKLGIPSTHAEIGVEIRLGYFDLFPREFEMFSENKWSVYFFTEAAVRAVGYNATLQGGIFNDSNYTLSKINNLIGSYKLGVSSTYSFIKLELATTFNTPEFPGALSHRWAHLKIQTGF